MSDDTKEKTKGVSPEEAKVLIFAFFFNEALLTNISLSIQQLAMFVAFAVVPILSATYVFLIDPDVTKKSFVIAEENAHKASSEAQNLGSGSNFANIKGLKSAKKA